MDRQRSRRGLLRAGILTLTGGLAGCSFVGREATGGGAGLTPAPVPTVTDGERGGVDERTLLVSRGQLRSDRRAGFGAMVERFARDRPDLTIRQPAGGSQPLTRKGLESQIRQERPPSVWQSEPGGKLRELAREGLLLDLGAAVWDDRAVRTAYAREVETLASPDGNHVAVPWYAQRVNNLFYNPDVIERAGVNPEALDGPAAFVGALESVVAETDATPLAVGTSRPWRIGHLFEAILVAQSDHRRIERIRDGEIDPRTSDGIREALETVASLARFLPPDADEIGWAAATERVVDGRAAMTISSDAAVGGPETRFAFGFDEAVCGRDWVHVPFPGTRGVFQFAAQSFVGPINNPTEELTGQWLRYCASSVAQRRFCSAAGTVPLRMDVDPDALPPFARRQYRAYREASVRVPSITLGLVVPAEVYIQYLTALFEFADEWDPEATADRLIQLFSHGDCTPGHE